MSHVSYAVTELLSNIGNVVRFRAGIQLTVVSVEMWRHTVLPSDTVNVLVVCTEFHWTISRSFVIMTVEHMYMYVYVMCAEHRTAVCRSSGFSQTHVHEKH